jgi:hypothetical protein
MDANNFKKLIIENSKLKSVQCDVVIGKDKKVKRRKWEITDINLGPILEQYEIKLRPKN